MFLTRDLLLYLIQNMIWKLILDVPIATGKRPTGAQKRMQDWKVLQNYL